MRQTDAASCETASKYPLHRDADCDPNARVSAVEEVIAIVLIADIHIVRVIPVIVPISRPGIDHAEPIASVLEARVPTNYQEGKAADPEAMAGAKVSIEPRLRNPIASVPSTLLPASMVRLPVARAVLLKCALPFLRLLTRSAGPLPL